MIDTAAHAALLDTELCVDPALFHKFVGQGKFRASKCLAKKGQHVNELSAYRYDVILLIGDDSDAIEVVSDRSTIVEIEFANESISRLNEMVELANKDGKEGVIITGIPNSRVLSSNAIGLSPNDLFKSFDTGAKRTVEIAPESVTRLENTVDVLVDLNSSGRAHRIFPGFSGHACSDISLVIPDRNLSNNPLHAQCARSVKSNLQEKFATELPSYMVPRALIVMQHIPLTGNGKVNRKVLSAHAIPQSARLKLQGGSVEAEGVPVSGEIQSLLQTIWFTLLGVSRDAIFANSNFFSLGGDSMTSLRLVGACRKAGLKVSVRQVFENPILSALAV